MNGLSGVVFRKVKTKSYIFVRRLHKKMLPTYTRFRKTTSRNNQLRKKLFVHRRALRAREKLSILFLFTTFTFACFRGVFFLFDDGIETDSVLEAYRVIQRDRFDIFMPKNVADAPNLNSGLPNGADVDSVAFERRNKVREVKLTHEMIKYQLDVTILICSDDVARLEKLQIIRLGQK